MSLPGINIPSMGDKSKTIPFRTQRSCEGWQLGNCEGGATREPSRIWGRLNYHTSTSHATHFSATRLLVFCYTTVFFFSVSLLTIIMIIPVVCVIAVYFSPSFLYVYVYHLLHYHKHPLYHDSPPQSFLSPFVIIIILFNYMH